MSNHRHSSGPAYPRVLIYGVVPVHPADGERSYFASRNAAEGHAAGLPSGGVINEYAAELRRLADLRELLLAALNDGAWFIRCAVVGTVDGSESAQGAPTPVVGSVRPASVAIRGPGDVPEWLRQEREQLARESEPPRRSTVRGMGAVRPDDEPTTRRRAVPPKRGM